MHQLWPHQLVVCTPHSLLNLSGCGHSRPFPPAAQKVAQKAARAASSNKFCRKTKSIFSPLGLLFTARILINCERPKKSKCGGRTTNRSACVSSILDPDAVSSNKSSSINRIIISQSRSQRQRQRQSRSQPRLKSALTSSLAKLVCGGRCADWQRFWCVGCRHMTQSSKADATSLASFIEVDLHLLCVFDFWTRGQAGRYSAYFHQNLVSFSMPYTSGSPKNFWAFSELSATANRRKKETERKKKLKLKYASISRSVKKMKKKKMRRKEQQKRK